MSYALSGAVSGLAMASVFVTVGSLMLFFLVKDPPPTLRTFVDRARPMTLTMGLVILAYPLWSILGAAMGLLYRASSSQDPAAGLGSPNLAFSMSIVVVAVVVALPLALLVRRVAVGVAALTFTFAGIFGWLLPRLAG